MYSLYIKNTVSLWRITSRGSRLDAQNHGPLKMLRTVHAWIFKWSLTRSTYGLHLLIFILIISFTIIILSSGYIFQLLRESRTSIVEILKLDIVSLLYIPVEVHFSVLIFILLLDVG